MQAGKPRHARLELAAANPKTVRQFVAERLRILMSAYACEPNRGSEPEVGWQWSLQMARFHDVTVVTRANNREVIEAALQNYPGPKPRFVYYDPPRWIVAAKRRGLPVAIFYALWQWGARRHFEKHLDEFDLIHHVTFNSFRQPGFWWNGRKPVLLGPLGGGQICPWQFVVTFGRRFVPEVTRSLSVLASRWLPHLRPSFRAARIILAANADTARRIPLKFRAKIRPMLETGIPREQIKPTHARNEDGCVRVMWLSRLERIKGAPLALRAFAEAVKAESKLRITFVGGGPEAGRLRELATQLGLDSFVTWRGAVSKAEVPGLFAQHDVFMFTSLRDTSGNVLLEAMAAGLPCVTLLHHGAAEIATDETAIRIPVRSRGLTAKDLADALVRLSRSVELRKRLGQAGAERVAQVYAWDRKGEEMDRIYREAAATGRD